jgi:hypothetical protein
MRVKDDCIYKDDLQAGRAWGNLGFKIADAIDREMTSADGIARLERACDLMTLVEHATDNLAALDMRVTCGLITVWIVDLQAPAQVREFNDPGAIEAAAAYARNGGGG